MRLLETTALILGVYKKELYNYKKVWDDYVITNKYDALFYIEPNINSLRSHIQKGSFLCSGKANVSIYEIYTKYYPDVINFVDIRKELYADVYEVLANVNLLHRTLFGGIEGFARDLKSSLICLRV